MVIKNLRYPVPMVTQLRHDLDKICLKAVESWQFEMVNDGQSAPL